MPTIHSTRSLLIYLAAELLASPLVHAVSDDRGSHSGTYRGRILTEQFLHEQSVARRGKRKIAGLDPEPAGVVRPDVGNIAVIDTSDGVVIERTCRIWWRLGSNPRRFLRIATST